MKKTLRELIDPGLDAYRSIGELARTLQHLLSTAHSYRVPMGDNSRQLYGPHETLIGYRYCVNCEHLSWHSGRLVHYADARGVSSWQQNHDFLYRCILSSLCDRGDIFAQWRKEEGIDLDMLLRFPMAYQNQKEEKQAWKAFIGLHGHTLPVPTLNSAHPRVNVLVVPELVINSEGVTLTVCVTQCSEMRRHKTIYSRWDACFLTETTPPRWRYQRETFAAFALRAVDFYKALTPGPRCQDAWNKKKRNT